VDSAVNSAVGSRNNQTVAYLAPTVGWELGSPPGKKRIVSGSVLFVPEDWQCEISEKMYVEGEVNPEAVYIRSYKVPRLVTMRGWCGNEGTPGGFVERHAPTNNVPPSTSIQIHPSIHPSFPPHCGVDQPHITPA
jgi:hypothetical protein